MVSVAKAPTRYRYEKNIKAKVFYKEVCRFYADKRLMLSLPIQPKDQGPVVRN